MVAAELVGGGQQHGPPGSSARTISTQKEKMNARDYIITKQVQWAKNNGVALIGSQHDKGFPAYALDLEDNLFEHLKLKTRKAFQNGDGGELTNDPAKMQAVHSSSALGVNIFQYWNSRNEVEKVAYACRFCYRSTEISENIEFEAKYPIDEKFRFPPNIDVVINNKPDSRYKVYAIECKFTEAYGGYTHSGIKEKYLDLDIWEEIPKLHELAKSISPNDDLFDYLHAAQLIKHILGLKRAFGKTGFRLLYLWYDALGYEGAKHREEIHEFFEEAKADNIAIHELSYQELIAKLADEYREVHEEYIEYITSRYL